MFRKEGGKTNNLSFTHIKNESWNPFDATYEALLGQTLKAMSRFNCYVIKFPNMC